VDGLLGLDGLLVKYVKYNINLLLKFFKVLYLDLDIIKDVISYIFSKG
jgi:hypothetical protein